jgi:hypothetical protein
MMSKMHTIENLWPSLEEIGIDPHTIAPVTVLREQAKAIRESTDNIIEGQVISENVYYVDNHRHTPLLAGQEKEVESHRVRESEIFIRYSLFLRLPVSNGKRIRLLSITHKVEELYPIRIQSSIGNENRLDKQVNSYNDLKIELKDFFHSPLVLDVLRSLLAQSGYQQES